MAAIIRRDTGVFSPGTPDTVTGSITTDATAFPSTTVSFTAGAGTSTAIGSTSGLLVGQLVDIVGAGAGGANMRGRLKTVTTGVSVGLETNPATTVAGAAMTPAIHVHTGGRPRHIKLVDLTALVEYEWQNGMEINSCLRQDAAGVRTLQTADGITPTAHGFYIAASRLPVSSKFVWRVDV